MERQRAFDRIWVFFLLAILDGVFFSDTRKSRLALRLGLRIVAIVKTFEAVDDDIPFRSLALRRTSAFFSYQLAGAFERGHDRLDRRTDRWNHELPITAPRLICCLCCLNIFQNVY